MLIGEIKPSVIHEMWLQTLKRHGRTTVVVVGTSMRPFIDLGDRVAVTAMHPGLRVRRGDIVLLKLGDELVVHRIIGWRVIDGKVYYRQKGDAGLNAAEVPAESVIGRVTEVRTIRGIHNLETDGARLREYFTGLFMALVDAWLRGARGIKRQLRINDDRQLLAPFSKVLGKLTYRIHDGVLAVVLFPIIRKRERG